MITLSGWDEEGAFQEETDHLCLFLNPDPDTTQIRPKHGAGIGHENVGFGAVLPDRIECQLIITQSVPLW
jgi:hypothetical protein